MAQMGQSLPTICATVKSTHGSSVRTYTDEMKHRMSELGDDRDRRVLSQKFRHVRRVVVAYLVFRRHPKDAGPFFERELIPQVE